MSRSLWTAGAILLIAMSSVQAATVTVDVTGTWTGQRTWNPGQLGEPTVETNLPDGGPLMKLSGSMSFDDGTNVITALSLTGEDITSVWAVGFDPVTLSGFSWTQVGTSLVLNDGASIACNGETGRSTLCGPGYQFGQGTFKFLTSFDGVVDDEKDFYCRGVIPGPATPGVCITVRDGLNGLSGGGNPGDVTTLDLWKGFNPFIPLASNAKFELEVVPVPAAVWLFGSALGGLGWLRRKKSV